VPTRIPTSRARAKSVRVSPPRTNRAARMNRAPSPVLTVRGMVCRQASLASLASGSLVRDRRRSRMRSNTTTESLTE
jgi:hypothetical protein